MKKKHSKFSDIIGDYSIYTYDGKKHKYYLNGKEVTEKKFFKSPMSMFVKKANQNEKE